MEEPFLPGWEAEIHPGWVISPSQGTKASNQFTPRASLAPGTQRKPL